jgi:hypothetical protein
MAFVAAFLPLGSFLAVANFDIIWAMVAAAASAMLGGIVCLLFGLKWNRGSGYHHLYFVPLEVWGIVYLIGGGSFIGCCGVGFLFKHLRQSLTTL